MRSKITCCSQRAEFDANQVLRIQKLFTFRYGHGDGILEIWHGTVASGDGGVGLLVFCGVTSAQILARVFNVTVWLISSRSQSDPACSLAPCII